MTTAADVGLLVAAMTPADALGRVHRDRTLAWLRSTDDVFRRVPPRTPAQHLVAYVVLRDPADGAVLLVDHRRSGLWLPAGGHVEPGEHPSDTARREVCEELGLAVDDVGSPRFLTVTETVGPPTERHVDVSLWYVVGADRGVTLVPDDRELAGTRWWHPDQVEAAGPSRFDPHLGRFLASLASSAT